MLLSEVTRKAEHPDDAARSVVRVTRYRYDRDGRLTAIVRADDGGCDVARLAIRWSGDQVAEQVVGELPDEGEVTACAGAGDTVVVTDGRGTARTYTLAAPGGGPRVVVAEAHARDVLDEAAPLTPRAIAAIATTPWSHHTNGLVKTVTSSLGRVTSLEHAAAPLAGQLTRRSETGAPST